MPMVAPNTPNARPRSRPENSVWMKPDTWGETMPAPSPCRTRVIDSQVGPVANPQAALAVVNSPRPKAKMARLLLASPRRPAGTSAMPNASA